MLCGLLTLLRRAPALTLSLCGAVAGCGYTSGYTPPSDGRARAVWRENNVVVEPAGAAISQECAAEMLRLTETGKLRLPPEYLIEGRGYWTPRYYGSPIFVVSPGLAPILPAPPLFLPRLRLVHPGFAPSPGGGAFAGAHGGGGSSGSGGGNGLVYLAVLVLLVLPAVDVGLALSRPESEPRSSQAIDQVNAFNDLARSPGSPCSYDAATAGPAAPGGLP